MPASERARGIWEEVKRNHVALNGCSGAHDLHPSHWRDAEKRFSKKHTCSKCGGWIESGSARWYIRGLEHGQQS